MRQESELEELFNSFYKKRDILELEDLNKILMLDIDEKLLEKLNSNFGLNLQYNKDENILINKESIFKINVLILYAIYETDDTGFYFNFYLDDDRSFIKFTKVENGPIVKLEEFLFNGQLINIDVEIKLDILKFILSIEDINSIDDLLCRINDAAFEYVKQNVKVKEKDNEVIFQGSRELLLLKRDDGVYIEKVLIQYDPNLKDFFYEN